MNYKIELDPNSLAVVGAALRKLPYEAVADLLANMQQQCLKQEAEAKAAEKAIDDAISNAE